MSHNLSVQVLPQGPNCREIFALSAQNIGKRNLEAYRRIEGHHTLAELGAWVRAMVLHLGGSVIPDGSFWMIHVPEPLQRKYHLAPRYEKICFDRALALRARDSELGGIGHPLVDALLREAKKPAFSGEVTVLNGQGNGVFARYLVHYEDEAGKARSRVMTFEKASGRLPEFISSIDWLGSDADHQIQSAPADMSAAAMKQTFDEVLGQYLVDWQPDRTKRARVQTTLVGLHLT